MKAIIFAGGSGTRLWPLSRKSSPKQFEKVVGDKSTLQLAVERLYPDFRAEDIYIFTAAQYVSSVHQQLPNIPQDHIFGEPEARDVGPAVGFAMALFSRLMPDEPVAILWSDHLVGHTMLFKKVLSVAETCVQQNKAKIVFIGQKPRFASQNLGWIEYGEIKQEINKIPLHSFENFQYRASLEEAAEFIQNGNYTWNIGYFVTTPAYLWEQYHQLNPRMYVALKNIQQAWGTDQYEDVLKKNYLTIEKVHFDTTILEKIPKNDGLVIDQDLHWSDVGAWEALKEALQAYPEQNVTRGKVLTQDCKDALIYNYTDQMVVAIDVEGTMIINTKDVVLICNKNSVHKIKHLVQSLNGTENEHLT